jgi:hypothetical protein
MAVHWELEHQCARRLYRSGLGEWQELRIREGLTAECAAVAQEASSCATFDSSKETLGHPGCCQMY